MPIEITLPRQGWTMEEGTFLGWLKKDGDTVKMGEPLFTVESDKAAFDSEAIDSGILSIPATAPKPGEVVKVGCVLGYLLTAGEAQRGTAPQAALAPAAGPAVKAASESQTATPAPATVDLPVAAATKSASSPRARRAAKMRQLDLDGLRPTGKGGRIRERDVLAVSAAPADVSAEAPAASKLEVPITAQRRTIAERMMTSREKTAPVTLTCRCDATKLVALRNKFKLAADKSSVPSFTDIIAKVAAGALGQHPLLAARWEGDHILLPDAIHIGIAVDTEHGLLVPVVRDVTDLSVREIARRSRSLIEAARSRRLKAEDMQGGCFTLSNLGGFGIEAFTPIINYPETAVLGLGAIIREPFVQEDGQLGVREQIMLSLTFDHRIVDGAPAARFLQTLRGGIEKPADALLH
jgi:pyruvate dehydrogenase E2 component (dihydrolipoamide acetyltransferase)